MDNLKIAITAARERGEPLEHILFDGPPDWGKPRWPILSPHEMSGKITATSGPAIERAGDLIGILTNLEKGGYSFLLMRYTGFLRWWRSFCIRQWRIFR